MNLLHRRLCASAYWRKTITRDVLPWVLDGVDLGRHALEIGPGPGAATDALRVRTGHLTCVEIDPAFAARLAARTANLNVTVLCEDATALSLAAASVDSAVSLTMLHHVPSTTLQDRLLAEVARVLRPGGIFAGFDLVTGPLARLTHAFDTMVPIDPAAFPARLATAGFVGATVEVRSRGFAFRAVRA